MNPGLPFDGLRRVLSTWTGPGQLYTAVAAATSQDSDDTRAWTAAHVRRRGNRVLFERLLPTLLRLPDRTRVWQQVLPGRVSTRRLRTSQLAGAVDWPATRRLGAWPPREYIAVERHTIADELLVTTLAWTADRLRHIRSDTTAIHPALVATVGDRLDALERAAASLKVESITRPSAHERRAVLRTGWPWSTVAAIADELVTASTRMEHLARALLAPDPEVEWRLFQLGVLGEVLLAADDLGLPVVSMHPVGVGAGGPDFQLINSTPFDVWYEAAGIWRHWQSTPPYAELHGDAGVLSPDVVVAAGHRRALVLECKTGSRTYVTHAGHLQTAAYLTEVAAAVPGAMVDVLLVGPQAITGGVSWTETIAGRIGRCGHQDLRNLVAAWLSA